VSPRTPRRGTPVTTAGAPDPPRGVRDFHVPSGPPNVHTSTPTKGSGTAACPTPAGARKTLTYGAHRTPPRHIRKTVPPTATTTPPARTSRTPARSPQDQGRYPRQLPRPTPCPTVYFLQCSTTVPRNSGGNDDFHAPLLMYPAPPCDYKRRRRASLKMGSFGRSVSSLGITLPTKRTLASSLTSILATLNFSSSRDLGASLPLSPRLYPLLQAPRVQDNTVPSHTPLLDVRPRGRNQDKLVRYCVASRIIIWDEKTRGIITSWVRSSGS